MTNLIRDKGKGKYQSINISVDPTSIKKKNDTDDAMVFVFICSTVI
jgi:hypothetical protein